jgi:hypothetical protein
MRQCDTDVVVDMLMCRWGHSKQRIKQPHFEIISCFTSKNGVRESASHLVLSQRNKWVRRRGVVVRQNTESHKYKKYSIFYK